MANSAQARKRARQAVKQRAHNASLRSTLRTAIKKVIKTDKDGNSYIGKKALRDAIFATKGLQGLTGPKNCDANGDCGVYNFTVFKFVNANEPFKLGVNPVKIYPKKS